MPQGQTSEPCCNDQKKIISFQSLVNLDLSIGQPINSGIIAYYERIVCTLLISFIHVNQEDNYLELLVKNILSFARNFFGFIITMFVETSIKQYMHLPKWPSLIIMYVFTWKKSLVLLVILSLMM